MTHAEIAEALKGYKAGTFGGPMKGVMKGQVGRYSDADLEAFAHTIGK
jgi:cytochrome c-type protein NapB